MKTSSDILLIALMVIVVMSVPIYEVLIKDDPAPIIQQESQPDIIEINARITVEQVIQPRAVEECRITNSQHHYVKFSYDYGADYDFGYTLAAIALKESNAGRWKVNIQDPSGGLYHVTLDKVLRDKEWEDTPFNRNRAMQLLVDNDEYAASLAVNELHFWKEFTSGNWLDMWASYNAGTNGANSERGQSYAEDIRQLIQKIQYCGWV